ncbi:MAG: sulfotransferase [Chthoniobacterales bacterium]
MSRRVSTHLRKPLSTKKAPRNSNSQPVFIVGSPRSGTSILTWCLGQHPNLLGLEESNWMAPFAVDLAAAYRRGSAWGERSQFSSMGIRCDQFMQEIGDCIIAFIAGARQTFEDRRDQLARPGRPTNHPAFRISRNRSDPKLRWVDGTPEYSLGICGLRKLFPTAKFIHIARDCDRVVHSMLNFDRVSGAKFVETESEGYQRWMAYVQACLAAEKAYGPAVVCRLLHQDLVEDPDKAMHRVLEFIGEPFACECLEPLVIRINSSSRRSDASEDQPWAESPESLQARELWATLRETPPPSSASSEIAALLEEKFQNQVSFSEKLEAEHLRAQTAHDSLHKEFESRTQWALQLSKEIAEKNQQILRLQADHDERTQWALHLNEEVAEKGQQILRLQADYDERTQWALQLNEEVAEKGQQILRLQADYDERTQWALQLDEEVAEKSKQILHLQTELAERAQWASDLKDELERKSEMLLRLDGDSQRKDDLIRRLRAQLKNDQPRGSDD